ncbi:MAG: hypothetical protein ACKO01_08420 [Erythrobacter sp.]
MADEATPTTTSEAVTTTETATPNDGIGETALGGATVEGEGADTDPDTNAAAQAEAEKDGAAGEEGESDAAPVVPEKYELTASEGQPDLDPAALEAATPVFQELGLTNEQAQKLIPVAEQFAASITDTLNKQILESVATERAAWLNEAKADEEIGGNRWDTSLVTAAKALDTLGFPKGSPLRNLLDDSGLGNHPEMIRAFVKVGRAISEDSDFPRSGAATTGARSAAETLYPSSK